MFKNKRKTPKPKQGLLSLNLLERAKVVSKLYNAEFGTNYTPSDFYEVLTHIEAELAEENQ